MTALYEGWMTHIAPLLDLTRYGPENSTKLTLMKINVFPDRDAFAEYNRKIGAGGMIGGLRAYYSNQEPRFICTYQGGDDEDQHETDQVQCHEAIHQLVHFYTWDQTRKLTGKEMPFLECRTRALWSTEGFAEFFSSHTVEGGTRKWMQPLEGRMNELDVFAEVVRRKGWIPWRLEQILLPYNGHELNLTSESHGKLPEDAGKAQMVFANQFYGKAWSLVHFLWYAEEGGRPKWRDRLVTFMKREFIAEYEYGTSVHRANATDFKKAFGLESSAAFDRFETEWLRHEDDLLRKHRKPEWEKERVRILELIGLDPKTKD
jgi:hypothetical protein